MKESNRLSIAELRRVLGPLFKKHNVIKAVVFGSYARSTEDRRSDLDLILIQNSDKRFFDRYDEFLDIHEHLRGLQVDLLIYTPEELERISSRPFIRSALGEGTTIYEH